MNTHTGRQALSPQHASRPGATLLGSEPPPRGIRQTMSQLHTWAGLLAGWILYAMFLTGTVSYFKDEISQWMRPELGHLSAVPDAAGVAPRVAATLARLAPDSARWSIGLPDDRTNVATAFWSLPAGESGRRRFGSATFEPATGQQLAEARDTRGGDFFYRFHFQLHYLPPTWGRWIAGLCAMFMLVAIVSGVITHKKIFVDFFTFRWGKGHRSWLDAHNMLSVLGLPFHLMITYTGLVTLMMLYMPWASDAAFATPQERQAAMTDVSAFVAPDKPGAPGAAMYPLEELVRRAQARWGRDEIGRVTINNPGRDNAKVVIARSDANRVSVSPRYLMFDGVDGTLLRAKDAVKPAAETRGAMFGLHLGHFADTVTRWLYFLVSLAGTAMVGTGLAMWVVKRRQSLPDPAKPYFGFRLVQKLNIATIAGLSIAMAAYLLANRLLPAQMAQRADWEIQVFFIAWAGALLLALVRPSRRAWLELLSLAAILLAMLPVVNAWSTDRGLFASLAHGDWVYAGFDLTALALALLHAVLAVRVARHRPRQKPAGRHHPAAVASRVPASD